MLYFFCIVTDYSLDNRHAELLRKHYVFLRNKIKIGQKFLTQLQSTSVLCSVEVQQINHEKVSQKANERLIQMITTKSPDQFAEFLKALKFTKQMEVVDRLQRGQVIVLFYSKTGLQSRISALAFVEL